MARLSRHARIEVQPDKHADDDLRIRWIKQDYWIGYTSLAEIRSRMADLINDPIRSRPKNLAIIGKPHSGKTALLNEFCREFNPSEDPEEDQSRLSVLMVDTPATAGEGRLYQALLHKLGLSGPAREPVDAMKRRLWRVLAELGVDVIALDEFNRGLNGAGLQGMLSAIRGIGNELKISFLLAGTEEVLSVLTTDDQMASRFPPVFTRRWADDGETRQLLATIVQRLPLRGKVNLTGDRAVVNILEFSEGILGEIIDIVQLLAVNAIKTGAEGIGYTDITTANLRRLGYTRPSLRSLSRQSDAESPSFPS